MFECRSTPQYHAGELPEGGMSEERLRAMIRHQGVGLQPSADCERRNVDEVSAVFQNIIVIYS
jgi:hypothetical protein